MSEAGSEGAAYLEGATIDAWHAPTLRNLWPVPEMAKFLKSGRNAYAAAYGSMTEVVHRSTQLFTDADLAAIATYLGSLPKNGGASVSVKPRSANAERQTAEALYKTRGGLGYVQFCSTCHQLDGRGVAEIFPPLAGNPSVLSADPSSVTHVVLSGWRSAETRANARAFGMPNFSRLSDHELAEIVTFIRTSWGNEGEIVESERFKIMRDQIELKPDLIDRFVMPRLADMLTSGDADRLVYGMRLMMQTDKLLPDNVGDRLTCSSCHLNGGTVSGASPYVGLAAQFPVHQARAGKEIDFKDRINGCLRRSMNGKILDKDSPQMLAMVAFVDWMKGDTKPKDVIPGRGLGKVSDAIIPDPSNGRQIYKNQCAICHGDNGEGITQADGTSLFPPLWGDQSFNLGAGIARTYTAAAFVKNNMPIANSLKFPLGQGGLTDQEAVDVAEYFTHMPRADFPDKAKDWPNGGKPKDARY